MRSANGFTLIEVLVALVAGSMLLVSLTWTLTSLTRQLTKAREQERAQRIATVAPSLVHMLEQAQPPRPDGAGFEADEKRLVAVVPPPAAAGPAGPVRLTLTVSADSKGDALVARFEPVSEGSDLPAALSQDHLLLEGYDDISFSYAPSDPSNLPHLPRLITIALTSDDGRVDRISAAPHVNSDGSCHFDPISMTCRH